VIDFPVAVDQRLEFFAALEDAIRRDTRRVLRRLEDEGWGANAPDGAWGFLEYLICRLEGAVVGELLNYYGLRDDFRDVGELLQAADGMQSRALMREAFEAKVETE
jgi:hypothetical protein